jgi:anti-anti-sigma factor
MSETYRHLQCGVERGVLVLTILEPELRTEGVVDAVRVEMFDAVARHRSDNVVLDLQKVRYVASAGFHPLLSLHRKLEEAGSRMLLCGLSPILSEVFRVTKLVRTHPGAAAPFESEPDVAAAVARLGGGAGVRQSLEAQPPGG